MKSHRIVIVLLVVLAAALAGGQMVTRPFHNGSVWTITFIRTHAGMDNAYLSYLTTDWKREQEAMKQEGIILSYKVLATEPHATADFNIMLMTEYKDLATMEANEAKADALGQKLFGSDEKIQQGYKNRSEMRDVLGERLAREIILEPKK